MVTSNRAVTLSIISSLLLMGCNLLQPTPTPTPPADEVALWAGQRMLTVQSLRFSIKISGEPAYLDDPPTIYLKKAVGDVLRPDSVQAIVTLGTFGLLSEVGVIGLGDDQYITNPLNQRWERVPPGQGWHFDPAILFDPDYGIEAVLRTTEWTFDTTADTDLEFIVLQGTVPGEKLWLLTSGVIRSGQYHVVMHIDPNEGYVLEISLSELESTMEEPTIWVIGLSHFDEPVDIQAPPVD